MITARPAPPVFHIKKEGFSADLFDYMLGASGGPKWFHLYSYTPM
jgi:hypothetical protein